MTSLGLSSSQARVYFALVLSGISTVKTISKGSKIARQDIYRIIAGLKKLGLVEEIITDPKKFRATPMHNGTSILMERRIKETSKLEAKTREFLKNFMENKAKTTIQEENPQLILIPRKEVLAKKRKKAIETAQTSMHAVTSWKRYSLVMFAHKEELKKALERGVQIHYITEKPEDEKSLVQVEEIVEAFKKHSSFHVSYVYIPVTTVVTLFDKKEVLVITSPSLGLDESPALWSNNHSLIELAENYFEMMWMKSLEDQHEKQKS